ncbi:hypothetical protein FNV43_RR06841 [Rhamnella rubrinervis]|uniref:non-specific serine/threonine protein kinase n=1 Tax=Rhamnella rubrinervis TaxID=2594499 RepID=A0A8K0HDN4_9ROSA|nr:hypothetical protein FNV43_RR06841 [Rhamnella rubrinervis]
MPALSPEISPATKASTHPPPSTTETTPTIPRSTPPPLLTAEFPLPPPVPPKKGNIPKGMLAGIGIGAIFMLVAVCIFLAFYGRWNRKKTREQGSRHYNSEAPPQNKEGAAASHPPSSSANRSLKPPPPPPPSSSANRSLKPPPPPPPSSSANRSLKPPPPPPPTSSSSANSSLKPPPPPPPSSSANSSLKPPPPPPPSSSANSSLKPSPGIVFGSSPITFTSEELEIATNSFSKENYLGKGGFGLVHKGVLPNGTVVAVKQLKPESGQGESEFWTEVDVISRVHHKHLVSLVGYCNCRNHRMLVYEFIPNNTLEFHLHGKGKKKLKWPTRMKIALGSAKGLSYLHDDCQPKIIHRDIKADNILLDDNFEAKVADFGLAKFFPESDTHVSTGIKGTSGYIDTEYASGGKLTNKSDVFSFGVVLLELITGREPYSMLNWARPLLMQALESGNYNDLIDPSLRNRYDSGEMTRMVNCAAACVLHPANLRPPMSEVVS